MDYRFLLHFYLLRNEVRKYEILHKKWDRYGFMGLLKLVKLTFFNYIYQKYNQNLSNMKENPYAKMTLDELKAQAKTVKTMMSVFSEILLVFVFVLVFLGIRKGFNGVFISLSIIPVALLPIFFVMMNSQKTSKMK